METIDAILKLNKNFKNNKWTEKDIDEFVFDNFCKLIDNLNNEQRHLIIDLVERYKWISFSDYPEKILSTLEKIEEEKLNSLKTIYLFPIKKPEDEGNYKSGQFLIYQIKCFKRHLTKYKNIEFKYISKFDFFKDSGFIMKENEALFLIDDYIGSGETLKFCLNEISKNTSISNTKTNIVTIASQFEIAQEIEKQGISYYADYIAKKGITDFIDSTLVKEKISIMLEIEEMIPASNFFSLGYNNSEALITMARTPDNTFPIFWKTYKKDNKKFEAPFSREETIEL